MLHIVMVAGLCVRIKVSAHPHPPHHFVPIFLCQATNETRKRRLPASLCEEFLSLDSDDTFYPLCISMCLCLVACSIAKERQRPHSAQLNGLVSLSVYNENIIFLEAYRKCLTNNELTDRSCEYFSRAWSGCQLWRAE